jgi:GT2 family glycosyltransferase
LLRRNLPHLNVLTFRRSALERIGAFDADPMMAEDFDLSIRAWTTLEMGFIETILSHQRVGNFVSLSKRTGLVRHYRNTQRVLLKNRRLLRAYFSSDSVWRDAYAEWATDFALVLLLRGQRREALGWAVKAIALRPSCLDARPYKYLLEALFSTRLYTSVVSAIRRFRAMRRSDLASGQL